MAEEQFCADAYIPDIQLRCTNLYGKNNSNNNETNYTQTCTYFDAEYQPLQIWLRFYIDCPLLLLGIIGNVANIIAFSAASMRKSPVNRSLLLLSISDLLILVSGLFMLSLPVVADNYITSKRFTESISHITRWLYPLGQMAATWSVYYTVFVSAYQCVVVRHRRFASKNLSKRKCDSTMGLVGLFGVLFNANRFLEVEIHECFSCRFSECASQLASPVSGFTTSKQYFLTYHIYLTAIVQLIIPIVVLIPVNIYFVKFLYDSRHLRRPLMNLTELIVKTVANTANVENYLSAVRRNSLTLQPSNSHRRGIDRDGCLSAPSGSDLLAMARKNSTFGGIPRVNRPQKVSISSAEPPSESTLLANQVSARRKQAKQEKELSITVMVLSVVAVFLLCNVVTFSTNIIEMMAQHSESIADMMNTSTFVAIVETGNTMVLFNSATTCLIYLRFNSKFREILWDRLCWMVFAVCYRCRTGEQNLVVLDNQNHKCERLNGHQSLPKMEVNGNLVESNLVSRDEKGINSGVSLLL